MARTLDFETVEHVVLESPGTTVVVEYDDAHHARLRVTATGYHQGSAEAARLACEAVHEARLHHADRIDGALDASSPACGAILEALHHRIGDDLDSIVMRRAGASVMVTLETHPVPTPSGPGATASSRVASRSGRVGQLPGVGAATQLG